MSSPTAAGFWRFYGRLLRDLGPVLKDRVSLVLDAMAGLAILLLAFHERLLGEAFMNYQGSMPWLILAIIAGLFVIAFLRAIHRQFVIVWTECETSQREAREARTELEALLRGYEKLEAAYEADGSARRCWANLAAGIERNNTLKPIRDLEAEVRNEAQELKDLANRRPPADPSAPMSPHPGIAEILFRNRIKRSTPDEIIGEYNSDHAVKLLDLKRRLEELGLPVADLDKAICTEPLSVQTIRRIAQSLEAISSPLSKKAYPLEE